MPKIYYVHGRWKPKIIPYSLKKGIILPFLFYCSSACREVMVMFVGLHILGSEVRPSKLGYVWQYPSSSDLLSLYPTAYFYCGVEPLFVGSSHTKPFPHPS